MSDVFPDWANQVRRRVDRAGSPGERVWAYIEANLALFASSEQAVAEALARVVDPSVLRGPMQDFHEQLQVPLREALEDLGEPDVARMAQTIDALVVHARRHSGEAQPLLRRLIGGYLGI